MKARSKKLVAVLALVCAVGIGAAGAFSYFTASAESKTNTFNIVTNDGTIEIEEPNWDPEDAKDLEPGQVVTKDPYVVSKVPYDGWIVAKVTVPKCSAKMATDTEFKKYEAVSLKNVDTTNYTLLKTVDGTDNVVYYYGFNTVVKAGAKTTVIFDSIQVKDFSAVESNFSSAVLVDASIIQEIDPSTGAAFANVTKAFGVLGEF